MAQRKSLQNSKTISSIPFSGTTNTHGPHMLDYLITFVALFATDVSYTYYLRAVHRDQAVGASVWAVVVFFIASVGIINYTTDHWQLIPACLGAACGTFVGMRIRNNH